MASTGRVFVIAGIEGGLDRGVVGGTPYSEGARQGGQGRSVDASAPLGGGPGLARGHDKAGNSGGSNHDGTVPGGGDREGLSQIKPSEFAKGLGEDTSAHHGKGPGGATREGKPAPRANNWKDVALDVAGILSFAGSSAEGHDDGVPGGLSWASLGGSTLQWLYVATSFLSFLDLAITGLGEVLAGMIGLVKSLFRLAWNLVCGLPYFFRVAGRLLARWGIAAASAGRALVAQGRNIGRLLSLRLNGLFTREFVEIFRFADRANPATLLPRMAQSSILTRLVTRVKMLSPRWRAARAQAHMEGLVEDSPFVSALLDAERGSQTTDPWLQSIIHGQPPIPGVAKAPDLGSFLVPKSLLIFPNAANQLSTLETEVLFIGTNLKKYLQQWKPNPY